MSLIDIQLGYGSCERTLEQVKIDNVFDDFIWCKPKVEGHEMVSRVFPKLTFKFTDIERQFGQLGLQDRIIGDGFIYKFCQISKF